MKKQALAVLTAAVMVGTGAACAYAASRAGVPADPYATENKQPAPGSATPSDPAAGAEPQPGARIPTSPPGTDRGNEGAATGESGTYSPAGVPADPYSPENMQPAPGSITSHPAAGAKPGARVPTSPPGTTAP